MTRVCSVSCDFGSPPSPPLLPPLFSSFLQDILLGCCRGRYSPHCVEEVSGSSCLRGVHGASPSGWGPAPPRRSAQEPRVVRRAYGGGAGRCVHALEDTRCMISDPSQLLSLRFSAYCVITRGPAVKEGRALPSMEGRGAACETPLGLGVLEAVSLHPPGSPEGSNRESRYSPAFPGLAADFGLRAAPFLHPVCREGPFFSAQRGTRLGLCNILQLFFLF